LVSNQKEFEQAFKDAIDVSFQDYVLLEEYFEGVQYSLETFSQNGTHSLIGLTEEFYTGPPQFVEEKHIMPGRLEDDIFNKVKEVIFQSLDVLEIKNGAAHSEIRVNKNGELCIIEIASRMGGDFRYKLIELSNGIDFLKMVILNSLGKEIEIPETTRNKGVLIKFILNRKEYKEYLALKKNHNIIQSEILLKDFLSDVNDSSQRFGYYIFTADTSQECLKILEKHKL